MNGARCLIRSARQSGIRRLRPQPALVVYGARRPMRAGSRRSASFSRCRWRSAPPARCSRSACPAISPQIGLILLIALSAKNAASRLSALPATCIERPVCRGGCRRGGRLRLRPILTSLAFILGLVPLVLASGAGANAQGSVVCDAHGMLGPTLLTVVVNRRCSWYCSRSRQG